MLFRSVSQSRYRGAIDAVDPDLAKAMVVDRVYRGGCFEFNGCNFFEKHVKGYFNG